MREEDAMKHVSARRIGRPRSPAEWALYLRHLARPVVEGVDLDREIKVALGNPYSLAGPLLVVARSVQTPRCAHFCCDGRVPKVIRDDPRRYPDIYLWWGLSDGSVNVMCAFDVDGDGSIVPQDLYTTIEVWTETELAALHALSNHVVRTAQNRDVIRDRIERAVAWHIENTQPDNATNHCWSVNTFLRAGIGAGSAEAMQFAETLVSNCLVQNARPDFLSAWILLDASRFLSKGI